MKVDFEVAAETAQDRAHLVRVSLVSILLRMQIVYIAYTRRGIPFMYTYYQKVWPSPSPILRKHCPSQSQAVDADPEQLLTPSRCCWWVGRKNPAR